MTSLEMKVELFEILAHAKDKNVIARFYENIKEILSDETDGWNDLSLKEQAKLDAAIAETYDPAKLVSHEEALKMIDKWLIE